MASSSSPESDWSQTVDLLNAVRGGRAEAQDQLVRKYNEPLRKLLWRRMSQSARGLSEVQDVIQETWLRVWRKLDRFEYRGVGSFWGYLRQVALNQLVDHFRSPERLTVDLPPDSALAPAPGTTPSVHAQRQEYSKAFEAALAALPTKKCEAVTMRLELGATYAEIARECGFPTEDAARMAVVRALKEIHRSMRGHES